jgi:protein-disulfide isomerase-like protein with CxxC motif
VTLEERSNLILAAAHALYVNGRATDRTAGATEQLGRALGLRVRMVITAAEGNASRRQSNPHSAGKRSEKWGNTGRRGPSAFT